MGHKISPISFRIGGLQTWSSKWFSDNQKYKNYLISDVKLRKMIFERLKNAALSIVEIERTAQSIIFTLHSSRPGIIIGRGGTEIEDMKKEIAKSVGSGIKIDINIKEIREPEADAATVGVLIAEQLEKRISFRRVIKRALERTMQNRNVKGCKIMVAGRLDGSEMSRREWVAEGKLPLHTLRANIDFAKRVAQTTMGAIGVKVWIYKGEVFQK
ncbi:MAG: 30S ribosomal protein S3 [Patescibacteria group bacterium]|jgi:small subunit ribosomal protein S3